MSGKPVVRLANIAGNFESRGSFVQDADRFEQHCKSGSSPSLAFLQHAQSSSRSRSTYAVSRHLPGNTTRPVWHLAGDTKAAEGDSATPKSQSELRLWKISAEAVSPKRALMKSQRRLQKISAGISLIVLSLGFSFLRLGLSASCEYHPCPCIS
jgi:hypothetical protein